VRAVSANGLEFGLLEDGPEDGPLALCLHGFPDTAHAWRHLLPALAEAGFHAVAPFTRGYAPTSVPADGDYSLAAQVMDAVALHEALGGDSEAVLIGHDWGSAVTFLAAAAAPERWRRIVGLAVPPLPIGLRLFTNYEQLRRFFYFFFFRTPLAEAAVAADDMAFHDRLWAEWSPGYDASEDLAWVKESLRAPENLTAAISYYRDEALLTFDTPPELAIPQPALYLHGDQDACIGVEHVRDTADALSADSRMDVVYGTGHFLHLEKPRAVNKLIVDWLA
jgi:pimeloyl-ACP methyl ester carboxylesterase